MLCNPTQSHTALSHKQLLELLCGIELALQTAEKNLHKIKWVLSYHYELRPKTYNSNTCNDMNIWTKIPSAIGQYLGSAGHSPPHASTSAAISSTHHIPQHASVGPFSCSFKYKQNKVLSHQQHPELTIPLQLSSFNQIPINDLKCTHYSIHKHTHTHTHTHTPCQTILKLLQPTAK